jgi:hypothetical protein
MNEWGFIGHDIFVGIGKSATSFKFESRRGYVRDERLVLSNPHSFILEDGLTSPYMAVDRKSQEKSNYYYISVQPN